MHRSEIRLVNLDPVVGSEAARTRPGVIVSGVIVDQGVLPLEIVERNRRQAEQVLRPWTPAFIHGDLHIEHSFLDDDQVSGIIDWSEARQGDTLFDLASLSLAKEAHLDDLLACYGRAVDVYMIRAA